MRFEVQSLCSPNFDLPAQSPSVLLVSEASGNRLPLNVPLGCAISRQARCSPLIIPASVCVFTACVIHSEVHLVGFIWWFSSVLPLDGSLDARFDSRCYSRWYTACTPIACTQTLKVDFLRLWILFEPNLLDNFSRTLRSSRTAALRTHCKH